MRSAGIDIGSRTIKVVIMEDGDPIYQDVRYNTHDPMEVCREMLAPLEYHRLTATGYGRRLFAQYWECDLMTEIRAVALGSRYFLPSCRTILDIGGQDTKVIALDPTGQIRKFEMNDKCAAGTGRFLEIMASALSFSMDDFIQACNTTQTAQKINSMCTVFAESEVISMVARGIPRQELALGIHQAIAGRAVGMLRRIPVEPAFLFTGGVAQNHCLKSQIHSLLNLQSQSLENPQIIAATGCALSRF